MNYSFKDYEDAIINALMPLHVKNGGYLRVIKGYTGELDADEIMRRFLGNSPGVCVEIYSAEYSQQTFPYYSQEVTVYIYVAAKTTYEQDVARKGEQGVFRILKDIRDRLLGSNLGLNIRPVEIKREAKLGSTEHTVLFAAQYVIKNDRIAVE